MRISLPNILYAAAHPLRALRYLRHRDHISYEQIAGFLPEDPVILEAGAHDGTNTVEMARFWPKASIHAFEPVPAASDYVINRLAEFYPRVMCHPVGLGPYDGEIQMHISGEGSYGDCQSSSMLSPSLNQLQEFPDVRFERTITVPVTTLDSWANREGIGHVDFLWLDMQAYELHALAGATRVMSAVHAVHMEVSNVQLYAGAPLYPEVVRRMASFGFRPVVEAIFRRGGNVLFVRRDERRRST